MSALAESESRPILLVTNDLGPRAGGIETFILGLIEQLPRQEIVVYTSSQPGDKEFDLELRQKFGVIVYRDRGKVLLPTPRVNRAVAKVMKRHKSATVWFGAAAPLAWMAPLLRRRGANRIISLTHGHEVWWSKLFPFSLLMAHIGRSLDVVTYLGEFTKSAMRPALGEKVELVQIAPGIDIDHFTPGAKSEFLLEQLNLQGARVLISVGRLVHRKGQDRLIEAMPEILKAVPNTVLVFIGQGPYKAELEKLVARQGVESSVRFIGRLTYPQLPEYIRLGDVFAMPSRSRFFGLEVEGLGIVYLEASACGLPVIAGNSGGAPDAVIEAVTGFAVDGNNVAAISQAAITLLADPALCSRMGSAGRAWIERDWDWKLWGARFNQLLKGN